MRGTSWRFASRIFLIICFVLLALFLAGNFKVFRMANLAHHEVNHLAQQQNFDRPVLYVNFKDFKTNQSKNPNKFFDIPYQSIKCPQRNLSYVDAEGPFSPVALLSFPGSGNTWLRHLIQQLTGYMTSSVYCDKDLLQRGFPGECAPLGNKTKRCIVYKTHNFGANKQELKKFDRAIILVRNPFYSLKSYFQYIKGFYAAKLKLNTTQQHPKQNSHVEKDTFDPHVAANNKSAFKSSGWKQHVGLQSKQWLKTLVLWLNHFENSSLLIRYEDLKEDIFTSLRRISEFLNLQSSNEEYFCTYLNREGKAHRHQKQELGINDIFSDEMIDNVNDIIMEVVRSTKTKHRTILKYLFTN